MSSGDVDVSLFEFPLRLAVLTEEAETVLSSRNDKKPKKMILFIATIRNNVLSEAIILCKQYNYETQFNLKGGRILSAAIVYKGSNAVAMRINTDNQRHSIDIDRGNIIRHESQKLDRPSAHTPVVARNTIFDNTQYIKLGTAIDSAEQTVSTIASNTRQWVSLPATGVFDMVTKAPVRGVSGKLLAYFEHYFGISRLTWGGLQIKHRNGATLCGSDKIMVVGDMSRLVSASYDTIRVYHIGDEKIQYVDMQITAGIRDRIHALTVLPPDPSHIEEKIIQLKGYSHHALFTVVELLKLILTYVADV
jgi:hypothetical protein